MRRFPRLYTILEVLILGAILWALASIGQSQNCPPQGCPTGIHGLVYTGPGNHWDPCSQGNDPYKAGLFSLDPLTFTDDARAVNDGIKYGVLPIYVINAVNGLNRATRWSSLTCQEQQAIVAASVVIGSDPQFGTNLNKTKVQWFMELWIATHCQLAPQPPYENPPFVPAPVPCAVQSPTPSPTATPVPTATPTPTKNFVSPTVTPTQACPTATPTRNFVSPTVTPSPTSVPVCATATPGGRPVVTRGPV